MFDLKSIAWFIVLLALSACTGKRENSQPVSPTPLKAASDSIGTRVSTTKNKMVDSLLLSLSTAKEDTNKANVLNQLAKFDGWAYGNYEKGLEYAQQAQALSEKLNPLYKKGLADAYNNFGAVAHYQANFPKALRYHLDALKIRQEIGYKFGIADSYNNIGGVYHQLGDYPESLKNHFIALKIREEIGHKQRIGVSYNNIGHLYQLQGNFTEALAYTFKGLEILKEIGEKQHLANSYNNIGNIYKAKGDYPNAIKYLFDALRILEELKDKFGIATSYVYIGNVYMAQSKHSDALQIFLDALKVFEEIGELRGIADSYNNIGAAYLAQRKIPEALSFVNKGLVLAKKIGTLERIKEAYQTLASIDSTRGDFKSAFANYRLYTIYKDSLTNQEKIVKSTQQKMQYDFDKKEAETKLITDAELRKQKLILYFTLSGLLALSYFYYTVKKKNGIIAQQNELNEHTIAILSHDIKEPLLGVKLMLKKLNKDDPFVAQASHSLEGQINSVNGILTNLLKMKKLSLVKKDKNAQADVQAVVKNVLQELNVAIQTKELTIQNDITEGLVLPIAPEKLQIIVHNLLSNAVKYSFPNQKIRIFNEGKGFCIQDFGVGLSPEQRSKLMREVTASQQGTKQERGNGLGLFLVGAMLQGENIKVVFDSPEVGGTVAKVLG
ncbi:MAG: tetratricopeptide repeat-containing sensor histidine kinase [Saprospiraceae bacterium]|nr:tetratricopeptide repeat-containing sensor histidine kinase [Saprospiraceae bacterium]